MPRITAALVFILGLLVNHVPLYGQNQGNPPKLTVFYSVSCHKCSEIKSRVMPGIEEEFKGRILIEYRDIGDVENYKLMLGLEDKHGAKIKNTLPVLYFEGKFLNGEGDVKELLKGMIKSSLAMPPEKMQALPAADLVTRFKNFRPLAVAGAGLIDGINPCAFTVIVFFISFLALQGYRKRELIVIGLSFISAVFFTYLFLGLGLFGFLYKIRGFWLLIKIFNILVGIFSIILGALCIYDIFKFRETGKTESLVLQLPKGVKNQIHRVIGLHYRTGSAEKTDTSKGIFKLFLSALATGFLVSILEAVCTGQMYLPTIAFVLKTTPLKLEAAGLLLFYNLMFIVPLFVIFIFSLWGVSSGQFAAVLRKHLLTVKMLMAMLFFGLGIFLLWRV